MKPRTQSMTFWALVVSAIAHGLVLLGATVDQAQQLAAEAVAVGIPIVGLIADYFGYRGRRRATEPLK